MGAQVNPWGALGLLAIAVVLVSYVSTKGLVHSARWLGLIQVPNARSSHVRPTPQGGGLAIIAGCAVGLLGMWNFAGLENMDELVEFFALSVGLAAVGLIDDLRDLPAWPRLLAQSLACLGLLWLSGLFEGWWGAMAVVLMGVWWLNLFNFMDGLDGLAASQAMFMLSAAMLLVIKFHPETAVIPNLVWGAVVVSSCLGFILLNWSPARIFLGDVGSTWLGFVVMGFAIDTVSQGWLCTSTWMVLGALFIVDASETLQHRVLAGESILQAHRSHTYQRLARKLGQHAPVTWAYLALNFFLILPLAYITMWSSSNGWWVVVGLYLALFTLVRQLRTNARFGLAKD